MPQEQLSLCVTSTEPVLWSRGATTAELKHPGAGTREEAAAMRSPRSPQREKGARGPGPTARDK